MYPKEIYLLIALCFIITELKLVSPSYNKSLITPLPRQGPSALDDGPPTDLLTLIYDGCFWNKGCVTSSPIQDSCVKTKVCEVLFSYGKMNEENPEGDEVVFELYAKEAIWVAIGLSNDTFMGDDYCIECVREQGGSILTYQSYNYYKKDNERVTSQMNPHVHKEFRLIKSVAEGSSLYCKFYIKKKFFHINPRNNSVHLPIDLNNPNFIIMARGQDVIGGPFGNLKPHKSDSMYNYGKKHILANRISPTDAQIKLLSKHGVFMIFTWVFLVSVGCFIPRYFKTTWVNIKIAKMQLWLFLHVAVMILALICIGISTYFQLLGKDGWNDLKRSVFHSLTGILSGAALLCLFILGYCIPKRKAGTYSVYTICHCVIGHAMFFLALSNLMRTESVGFAKVPCGFMYLVLSWIITYIVVNIAMSYHHCWIRWIIGKKSGENNNQELYSVSAFDALTQHAPDDEAETEDSPGTYVRTIILVIYSFLSLVFALAFILRLHFNEVPCYKTTVMTTEFSEIHE